MVFPSLAFQVEPGMISQFSALAVVVFSFLIHRLKKVIVVACLLLAGIFFFNYKSHAIVAYNPQVYNQNRHYPQSQTPYYNNFNYYGQPWGYAPPVYFYPQLQYHTLWGPQQQNYFQPHPYSPYAPQPTCPFCGPQPQQPTQPQFPYPYVHPGGGVS